MVNNDDCACEPTQNRSSISDDSAGVEKPDAHWLQYSEWFDSKKIAVSDASKQFGFEVWQGAMLSRPCGFNLNPDYWRDAYIGARDDLAIWKRRALEAEAKLVTPTIVLDDGLPSVYDSSLVLNRFADYQSQVDSLRSELAAARKQRHSISGEQDANSTFTPPAGFALVPIRLNRDMEEVLSDEGWEWEDLLAAAGTVTEEQIHPVPVDECSLPDATTIMRNLLNASNAYGSVIEFSYSKEWQAAREFINRPMPMTQEQLDALLDWIKNARPPEVTDTTSRVFSNERVLNERLVGYLNECGEPVFKDMTQHDIDVCACGGMQLLFARHASLETA